MTRYMHTGYRPLPPLTMAPRTTPALLIVDMLNLFDFEGGKALGKAALGCARSIARLRARFDEAGAPVIYVNDNFTKWQGEFRDLIAHCATTPGPPAEIARLLSPRPNHYYVLKPKHSAFLGTPLSILLGELDVRQLVLSGTSADSCILATAQDANMREFELWVPRDVVASITPEQKARGLALLKATLHAEIRSTRSIAGLFPKATPEAPCT